MKEKTERLINHSLPKFERGFRILPLAEGANVTMRRIGSTEGGELQAREGVSNPCYNKYLNPFQYPVAKRHYLQCESRCGSMPPPICPHCRYISPSSRNSPPALLSGA